MTKDQLARCDMLARVRNFGEMHRDKFPDGSIGGQAFASVAVSLQQLSEHTINTMSTIRDRRRAQQTARTALGEQLDAITRTARVIGHTRPGFDNPFRMPEQRTESVLLTTARVFVQGAEPLASQFIAHGMPQTFIADAKAHIDQLERAMHDHQIGKSEQLAARTAAAAALSTGMAAARTLDLVVANQFRDDAVTLAVWKRVRQLNAGRRPKTAAVAATTTTAASPVAASPVAASPVVPAERATSPAPTAGPVSASGASSAPNADPLATAEKASGVAS